MRHSTSAAASESGTSRDVLSCPFSAFSVLHVRMLRFLPSAVVSFVEIVRPPFSSTG